MSIMRRFVLLLLILLSMCSIAYAGIADGYNKSAEELYSIGLFKGGDNGFELESQPTRVQAAVMAVRFIGEEGKILSGQTTYTHPFKDVPEWANAYVGFMYANGITKGLDANNFGSDALIDANAFTAFMLRAMGYSDSKGDFQTAKALEFATEIDILTASEAAELRQIKFTRGGMAYISRCALNTNMKGHGISLGEYLQENGVINAQNLSVISERVVDPSGHSTDTAIKNGEILSDLEVELDGSEIIDGDSIIDETEVVIENSKITDVKMDQVDSKTLSAREQLIKVAYQQLGVRYRSGGKSPSTGFDCSGFVGYAMVTSSNWSTFYGSCVGVYGQCTPISLDQAEPGDIVFFKNTYSTSNAYTHVGIYLGDKKMIHSGSSTGVAVASFASGYWADHYACVARPNVFITK